MAEHLSLYMPEWLAYTLAALLHAFLLINVIAVGALFFIWQERKVCGRIQDRLGPTRVGGKFGWLQTLADGLKLLSKEDTMPKGADGMLFRMAPYISFCASYAAFMVLPFASGWNAIATTIGAFLLLALLGLEVFGVILAGYASGSKWSLFGGMREAAQVVSYEVPLGLSVIVPVVVAGTMDLSAIGDMQRGWFTNWFLFHDPFTFITFWVFFTCATASVNRAPFDLAEAESELVAGFHTEYSGLRWSFFFMAEYGSMFLVSGVGVVLFLGAWNGPIPILEPLAYQSRGEPFHWGGFLANVAGVANFIFKSVILVTVMMWVRWTLPRLRIDQVMKTCLKYCMPIVCFTFLGATIWSYFVPGGLIFAPAQPYGAVRDQSETFIRPPMQAGMIGGQQPSRAAAMSPPASWEAAAPAARPRADRDPADVEPANRAPTDAAPALGVQGTVPLGDGVNGSTADVPRMARRLADAAALEARP